MPLVDTLQKLLKDPFWDIGLKKFHSTSMLSELIDVSGTYGKLQLQIQTVITYIRSASPKSWDEREEWLHEIRERNWGAQDWALFVGTKPRDFHATQFLGALFERGPNLTQKSSGRKVAETGVYVAGSNASQDLELEETHGDCVLFHTESLCWGVACPEVEIGDIICGWDWAPRRRIILVEQKMVLRAS